MYTNLNLFLESISNDDKLLKKGIEKLIETGNIEILLFLLKNNFIKGNILNKLWYISKELDFDDKSDLENLKKFIILCLENGGNINSLDDDLEPIYIVIWDHISKELFDDIIEYELDYTLIDVGVNKIFYENLKNNHPKEYEKYLKQKSTKKFKI